MLTIALRDGKRVKQYHMILERAPIVLGGRWSTWGESLIFSEGEGDGEPVKEGRRDETQRVDRVGEPGGHRLIGGLTENPCHGGRNETENIAAVLR